MSHQSNSSLAFTPASELQYECTIHTLEVRGDDGHDYKIVLDLIRSDKNPQWNVLYDHLALRAAVVDAQGQVIASIFKESSRGEFASKIGRMHIMNAEGHIAFVSTRGPDGNMLDGHLDFDLRVDIVPSGKIQSFADELKSIVKKYIGDGHATKHEELQRALALQLLVTDYSHTRHTGTIVVKRQGIDEPLILRANNTRSTMSHHYGNSLTEYVFLASVPREGMPNFIAVITREAIKLSESKLIPQMVFPVGYLLRTDAAGHTSFSFLRAKTDRKEKPGFFDVGMDFLGIGLEVRVHQEVGSVCLNDDQLPARTAFGTVTIHDHPLGKGFITSHDAHFANVIIDITGQFLDETGWGTLQYGA